MVQTRDVFGTGTEAFRSTFRVPVPVPAERRNEIFLKTRGTPERRNANFLKTRGTPERRNAFRKLVPECNFLFGTRSETS